MKRILFLSCVLATLSLTAAEIRRTVVRQQWPWSRLVQVEYELAGVTDPVDVVFAVTADGVEIPSGTVQPLVRGRHVCLTKGGAYTASFDPVDLGLGTGKIKNLKVSVTAVAADSTGAEVLYKIVNLESPYDVTDVTRAELLNGDYGAVETDFGKIGEGFTTSAKNLVIWTGVTNNPAYKTTHLVMRKIPAKDVTYTISGSSTVTFTNDYYMGVFEVTQTQFKKVIGGFPDGSAHETNALYSAMRPADKIYYSSYMRGTSKGKTWPTGGHETGHTNVDSNNFVSRLQQRTGLCFDLPTEARWDFAARGGTGAYLYSGKDTTDENARPLMRAASINNAGGTGDANRNCDLTTGPNIVGSYAPNAYGLYDVLGNVWELCLDYYDANFVPSGIDPVGPSTVNLLKRVLRGGAHNSTRMSCRSCYHSYGRSSLDEGSYGKNVGYRLCLYPEIVIQK